MHAEDHGQDRPDGSNTHWDVRALTGVFVIILASVAFGLFASGRGYMFPMGTLWLVRIIGVVVVTAGLVIAPVALTVAIYRFVSGSRDLARKALVVCGVTVLIIVVTALVLVATAPLDFGPPRGIWQR